MDSKEIWQNDLTTIGWINGAHKKITLCQPMATQICNGINKLYNDTNDNRKLDPEQHEKLHAIYTLPPDNHCIIVKPITLCTKLADRQMIRAAVLRVFGPKPPRMVLQDTFVMLHSSHILGKDKTLVPYDLQSCTNPKK